MRAQRSGLRVARGQRARLLEQPVDALQAPVAAVALHRAHEVDVGQVAQRRGDVGAGGREHAVGARRRGALVELGPPQPAPGQPDGAPVAALAVVEAAEAHQRHALEVVRLGVARVQLEHAIAAADDRVERVELARVAAAHARELVDSERVDGIRPVAVERDRPLECGQRRVEPRLVGDARPVAALDVLGVLRRRALGLGELAVDDAEVVVAEVETLVLGDRLQQLGPGALEVAGTVARGAVALPVEVEVAGERAEGAPAHRAAQREVVEHAAPELCPPARRAASGRAGRRPRRAIGAPGRGRRSGRSAWRSRWPSRSAGCRRSAARARSGRRARARTRSGS